MIIDTSDIDTSRAKGSTAIIDGNINFTNVALVSYDNVGLDCYNKDQSKSIVLKYSTYLHELSLKLG